eukprot:5424574-Prymnesium_polylepis.1
MLPLRPNCSSVRAPDRTRRRSLSQGDTRKVCEQDSHRSYPRRAASCSGVSCALNSSMLSPLSPGCAVAFALPRAVPPRRKRDGRAESASASTSARELSPDAVLPAASPP